MGSETVVELEQTRTEEPQLPQGPLTTQIPLKPFPPPSLVNVPLPYILDSLHRLAVHYWDKPETADCTIVIPMAHPKAATARSHEPFASEVVAIQPFLPLTPPDTPNEMSSFPRERPPSETAPQNSADANMTQVSRMTCKLHLDYLIAQCSLFRSMFNGKDPLEHFSDPRQHSPPEPALTSAAYPAFRKLALDTPTPSRTPRMLPSTAAHPIILLPLPHPESFPHLVHYMYHGTPQVLEDALNAQQLNWDDVVRNVEYLGMRTHIKVFLGKWYAQWVRPGPSSSMGMPMGTPAAAKWGNSITRADPGDWSDIRRGGPRPSWPTDYADDYAEGEEESSYDGSCSEFGSEYDGNSVASGSSMRSVSVSRSRSRERSDVDLDMGEQEERDDVDMDDWDEDGENGRLEMGSLRRAIVEDGGENENDAGMGVTSQPFSGNRTGRQRERGIGRQEGGGSGSGPTGELSEEEPSRGRTRVRTRSRGKVKGAGASHVALGARARLEVDV